ncbi:hypothetical protein OTU49_010994, partial [Cherax quadricarinatus]
SLNIGGSSPIKPQTTYVSTVITNYADHHAADHYGGSTSSSSSSTSVPLHHHHTQGSHHLTTSGGSVSVAGAAVGVSSLPPHMPPQLLTYQTTASTSQHILPNSQQLSHQVQKEIPVLEPLEDSNIKYEQSS